jgi:hypothetical protein
MNTQEEALTRRLPLPIVMYHVYLRVLHSGLTPDEVMKLNDTEFGHFVGECCQITRDAAITPYQRDVTAGFGMTLTGKIKLIARGTENMVSSLAHARLCVCLDLTCQWQGLPCGAPQFLGRTVRKLSPIPLPPTPSMAELHAIVERCLQQMAVGVHCGSAEVAYLGLEESANTRPHAVSLLSDMNVSLLKDDCESSGQLATEARMSLMDAPDTPEGLRAAIGDWPMFAAFTDKCYAQQSRFINRAVPMLRSGTLKIAVAVGLAEGAAASDKKNATDADYSGHCFNVACVTTGGSQAKGGFDIDDFVFPLNDEWAEVGTHPAGPQLRFAIMEGTAPTNTYRVTPSSPQIVATMFNTQDGHARPVTKVLPFTQYVSNLAQVVNELTRVINAPNGGRAPGGGWPLRAPPVTGWTSSELLMNSLDSCKDSYLEFYNRVIFMGWKCKPDASGCMPVETCKQPAESGTQFLTGCHPYELNNQHLQAIDALVPSEHQAVMDAIMNEAHPPLVDESVLRRIADYWAPCSPFADVNADRHTRLDPSLKYVRVACMESPGIPELVPAICLAKHMVFQLADKINRERPDSDGVRFVSSPKPEGTGFHGFLEVPDRSHTPTAPDSVRKACALLDFPGYTPLPTA